MYNTVIECIVFAGIFPCLASQIEFFLHNNLYCSLHLQARQQISSRMRNCECELLSVVVVTLCDSEEDEEQAEQSISHLS
jgi:hypothetical protein